MTNTPVSNAPSEITIIGGGLAGSEAAWQAAQRGFKVRLYEMRPSTPTGAHLSGDLAELVCSNSLGSNLPDRASGVLKNELRTFEFDAARMCRSLRPARGRGTGS